METFILFSQSRQAINALANNIPGAKTGPVRQFQPRDSLCRNYTPEPQFYSLPPETSAASLCERSVSDRIPTQQMLTPENDGDDDKFFGWDQNGDIETDTEEFEDAETFNSATASSLTMLFHTARDTLQRIFNGLAGKAPEHLLHTLHQNSILVAQFRQEKEETTALLATRVAALEEDIGQTFSRLSPRKSKALKDIGEIRRLLETLKRQNDENALNELLDGILAYETEYEKVSWVLLSSLAFLNMAEQSDAQLIASMTKVVPAEILEAGTADMLNPGKVHKYDRRYTGSRHIQKELVTLIQQRIEKIGAADALNRVYEMVGQLDTTALGTPGQMKDPKQAMVQVIETQPVQAARILATYFKTCDFDTSENTQKTAKAIQAMLTATPQENGSGYLKVCLARFNGAFDAVLAEIGKDVQKHYLQQQNQQMKEQVSALLEGQVVVPQQQFEDMTRQTEQLRMLAADLNYNTNPIKTTAREVQKLSARKVINAMAAGDSVWHLGATLNPDPSVNLQLVTDAIHGKDSHPFAEAIRKLHAYLLHSDNIRADGYSEELRRKDELMICQRDLYMAQARNHLDDRHRFLHASFAAQSIEALRPRPMLLDMLKGTASPMDVAKRLGRGAMTAGALPFVHQMKELQLMHELTRQGYNFEEEAWDLLNYLPSAGSHLWEAGKRSCNDGQTLVNKLKKMDLGPLEAAREITRLGAEATDRLTKDFREVLTGAALLGKTNPRLLRALNGNLRQTLTVLANTVGSNSMLYDWFNELHNRVSAEAWAQCVIDNLDNEPVDLSKLPADQLKAVKRLVTLNRLLTCGPYVPHVLNAALGTVQSAGNPISTACTWARAGANIIYSRLVQTKVNALEGKDVQALNTLMDTLTEGPAYAAWRQQMMEQSGQLIADIACKKPINAALSAAGTMGLLGNLSIFGFKPLAWLSNLSVISVHPYRTLGRRVSEAFRNWWHGKPGSRAELGIMLLQCAPAVAAPAASLIPLIFAPGFIGLVGTVSLLPLLAWGVHSWIREVVRYTGMTDAAIVVARHVSEYCKRPDLDVNGGVNRLLKETKYVDHVQYMAKNHAFAAIADGYWDNWVKSCKDNGAKAGHVKAEIHEAVDKDFKNHPAQFNRLKQIMHALHYLKTCRPEQVREAELKKLLPAEDVPALPASHHRIYWVQVMIRRLHDEMFSAIGCDDNGRDSIPGTEKELETRLKKFIASRLCGAMLVYQFAPARDNLIRAQQYYTSLLMSRAQELTEVDIMKTVEHAMTAVRMNRVRLYSGFRDGKINPDDFDNAVNNDDKGFTSEMKNHISDVVMAEYRNAFAFSLESMKRQLRSQQIKDGQITELLAQINKTV